jgi:uncharacterized protein YeaO (DUF488 family)
MCHHVYGQEQAVSVVIKRAYEARTDSDGTRILVDRLWPRGLSRDRAAIDRWLKDIAPSTGLRKWFAHIPERWPEFERRYLAELKDNPMLSELRDLTRRGDVMLVYASSDQLHNEAVVLKNLLDRDIPR